MTADAIDARAASDSSRRRGRLVMLLVLAVCAAPVVLGTLVYYHSPPSGRTNYGVLLPLAPVHIEGRSRDGAPFSMEQLRGKWVLVLPVVGRCDEMCERALFITRQARTAQGKEQARLERLVLLAERADIAAPLESLLQGAHVVGTRERDLESALGARASEHIWLVDPLGNLMLRFPTDPDAKRVVKDLRRLLAVNRIG